jgi:hypothetical protein
MDWSVSVGEVGQGDGHASRYTDLPWSRVLLEKLTGFELVKKFPTNEWLINGSLAPRHGASAGGG